MTMKELTGAMVSFLLVKLAVILMICFLVFWIASGVFAAQLNSVGRNQAAFFSDELHADANSASDILDTAIMHTGHFTLDYQRTAGTGNLTFRIQSSVDKSTWRTELEVTDLVNTSQTVIDFDRDLNGFHRFMRVETVNSDPGPTTFTVSIEVTTRSN